MVISVDDVITISAILFQQHREENFDICYPKIFVYFIPVEMYVNPFFSVTVIQA